MPDHQQAAIEAGARAYDPEAWTAYDRESPSTEGRELMVEYSKSKAESILAAAEPHLRRKWAAEVREKVNPPDAEHDREVAAKTLIDVAQDIYLPAGGPSTYVDIDYAELLASLYLKARAEQIEKGTGE